MFQEKNISGPDSLSTMGPVPEDNHNNNPAENDPANDPEELEGPGHIIPPGDSSSDDDNDLDSDMEGPANDGYMLLPQDPEEEGGGDTFQPQPFPPFSALEEEMLPTESMTEVRGAGVDVSQAVAEGSVHPAFAANFPDNKVPVHLQVPDQPKTKKDDVLWNQAPAEADQRLQLDSAHLSKVKSAMAGFQLPKANIPDWARQIPEDDWKRQLVDRLTSPTTTTRPESAAGQSKQHNAAADIAGSEESQKQDSEWPGTSGT